MPRVLLILPTGSYRAAEYLAAAERLGVEVVVASERAQALAATMGENFLEIPLHEPAEAARRIVAQARRDPRLALHAILGVDDQGLLAAALAAAELGLPHNSPESVALTRDKAAMRAAFAAGGVPQPDSEVIPSGDPAAAAAAAKRLGPPVVLKPTSLAGSRGVIRADTPGEAGAAASRIRSILDAEHEPADAPMLVERFVPGPEVAVEGILRAGSVEIITIFDKPDPLDGPFFEETLYLSPTILPHHVAEAVGQATEGAVRALGLSVGPFHAEMRVPGAIAPGRGDAVKVLEVAARTIGGRCSKAMVLEDGSSLEELVIANALGGNTPATQLRSPCGILMVPIPGNGTLRSVDGIEQVRDLEGVTGVEMTIAAGRPVRALPEGDRYLGFVFVADDSRETVERSLREAQRLLVVHIDPVADLAGAGGPPVTVA